MADLTTITNAIFAKYDLDQSGTLSKDDTTPFYNIFIANRPDLGLTADGYVAWFDAIDLDHDDTISNDELKAYLAGVNYTNEEN